jgi:gamma-glutamyl hercynylcysteine S-oxide synthase
VNPTQPPPDPLDARHLAGNDLALALHNARERSWLWVDDLTDAQWLPARQSGVNPIAWELAHLAWFAEYWTLRAPHDRDAQGFATSPKPPHFAAPDAHFDSARLAHEARWTTPLPSRKQLKALMAAQLDATVAAIDQSLSSTQPLADEALYFHRLALFHEDMHGEALCWLRSALGYAAPPGLASLAAVSGGSVCVAGAEIEIGLKPGATGFAFDNEGAGAHIVLKPFEIDASPVSAGEFSRFVNAGAYDQADFWPRDAGKWRAQSGLSHPQAWRRNGAGKWQLRWFDQWLPLDSDVATTPVIHVNAFEAEAYCLWAKRRLPSAAEWAHTALTTSGFHWGHSVWEWTADAFQPYPGFSPGPYREYSLPWFGNHRELRGGAFATHARMHNPRYRNFFLPNRSDIFAGFRTVAL